MGHIAMPYGTSKQILLYIGLGENRIKCVYRQEINARRGHSNISLISASRHYQFSSLNFDK